MKISVILPCYNEEENLPKVVDALRKQTLRSFEIIVVDNNSRDNTLRIAKKIADKIYKCKEQGISPARNLGARKASGEIICFLDADSIPDKNWMQRIIERFSHDKKLTAITGLDLYEHESFFKRSFLNFFARMVFYYGKISTAFNKPIIIANNLAIRKDVFLKIGGFDKLIVEDHYLSLKLQKEKNVKVVCDRKMKIVCSSRRIRKVGILKTYYLWFMSTRKKISAEEYKLHDRL